MVGYDEPIRRGDIWWADLAEPDGSGPGFRRPVLIVQTDSFNRSMLNTAVVVPLTGSMARAGMPGNVLLPKHKTGLPKDSVANVTQLSAQDKAALTEKCGRLDPALMRRVGEGMRLVLGL